MKFEVFFVFFNCFGHNIFLKVKGLIIKMNWMEIGAKCSIVWPQVCPPEMLAEILVHTQQGTARAPILCYY